MSEGRKRKQHLEARKSEGRGPSGRSRMMYQKYIEKLSNKRSKSMGDVSNLGLNSTKKLVKEE